MPGGVLFQGAQLVGFGPARRAGEHVAVADQRRVGLVEIHRAAEQALVFPGLPGIVRAGVLEPHPFRVERLIVGEPAGVTQPAGENGLHQMAPHRLAAAAGIPEYPRFIAAQPGFHAAQVADPLLVARHLGEGLQQGAGAQGDIAEHVEHARRETFTGVQAEQRITAALGQFRDQGFEAIARHMQVRQIQRPRVDARRRQRAGAVHAGGPARGKIGAQPGRGYKA